MLYSNICFYIGFICIQYKKETLTVTLEKKIIYQKTYS